MTIYYDEIELHNLEYTLELDTDELFTVEGFSLLTQYYEGLNPVIENAEEFSLYQAEREGDTFAFFKLNSIQFYVAALTIKEKPLCQP